MSACRVSGCRNPVTGEAPENEILLGGWGETGGPMVPVCTRHNPTIRETKMHGNEIHLANAGQALPGDIIGVDARGEQRVIGEIIESGSGWEVFDADGSDWGYWGPTEALTVYRPQSTSGKCADCDAPGVRMDHGDGGPGSDFSVKLRCERHSRPDKIDEITIPAVTDAQRAQSTVLGACHALTTIASTLFGHDTDAEMVEALAADLHALADRLGAAAGHLRIVNDQN